MSNRLEAKVQIEILVRYFEQNIHQLKAPSFNEAQARQSLIDPFFEALGWDVRNRQMKPPHQWEVLPEGRVRTSVGRVSKEQTTMFDASTAVKEEMKEYVSMLEYIADGTKWLKSKYITSLSSLSTRCLSSTSN